MTERRLAKYAASASASLAIGACCALYLLMLIALSSEVRRRIGIEFGVNEPVRPPYGVAMHAAIEWQMRNLLGLALAFLGSAAALAFGIVARRGRPQTNVVATVSIYLSLLDLVGVVVLFWVIS